VLVYKAKAELVAYVMDFVLPALRNDEAGLVVATPVHRALFAEAVDAAGFDVPELRRTGQYVELDAEDTLGAFFIAGRIHPSAFRLVIGDRIRTLTYQFGRVNIYGEMVARLWGRGDTASALQLEHLWNDLMRTHPFRLCCAYAERTIDAAGTPADLEEMHRTHAVGSSG
jgi:hypothetical protein